jgi:uncharacterized protein
MQVSSDGELLHIFIDESARYEGTLLSSWIVRQAQKMGLAGACVFRGSEGLGINGSIQTIKILDLSCKLPTVVIIFDIREKIANFLPLIEDKVKEGVILSQQVSIAIQGLKREPENKSLRQ